MPGDNPLPLYSFRSVSATSRAQAGNPRRFPHDLGTSERGHGRGAFPETFLAPSSQAGRSGRPRKGHGSDETTFSVLNLTSHRTSRTGAPANAFCETC